MKFGFIIVLFFLLLDCFGQYPLSYLGEIKKSSKKDSIKYYSILREYDNAIKNKDYKNGLDAFKKLIELPIPTLIEHNNPCNKSIVKKRWCKECQEGVLEEFTKIEPNYEDAYFYIGEKRLYYNDRNGAIKNFSKTLQLNPNYFIAYRQRAEAHYKNRDFIKAIDDYSKFISEYPNDAYSYYRRGIIKNYIQDYKGAIEDFYSALDINSDCGSFFAH